MTLVSFPTHLIIWSFVHLFGCSLIGIVNTKAQKSDEIALGQTSPQK